MPHYGCEIFHLVPHDELIKKKRACAAFRKNNNSEKLNTLWEQTRCQYCHLVARRQESPILLFFFPFPCAYICKRKGNADGKRGVCLPWESSSKTAQWRRPVISRGNHSPGGVIIELQTNDGNELHELIIIAAPWGVLSPTPGGTTLGTHDSVMLNAVRSRWEWNLKKPQGTNSASSIPDHTGNGTSGSFLQLCVASKRK